MRFRKMRQLTVVAAVAATCVVATASPAVAAPTALPFGSFTDMVVDAGRERVFLAGGDQVVATDRDGRILRTISGQTGVYALAFTTDHSLLYAALKGANAISVIDTKKLREVARYSTGTLCPGDLLMAVGKLWFSAACNDTYLGTLNALDPATGQITTYVSNLASIWGPALLAVSVREGWPITLVTAARDLSSSQLRTYDITFGEPDFMCWNPGGCQTSLPGIVQDMAVSEDGANLLIAQGAQYHTVVSVFGMAVVDTYPTGAYPTAVAVGQGGLLALGSESPNPPEIDVFTFLTGSDVPTWTHDFGLRETAYNDLAPHGLAWGAGNTRLYAVVTDDDGSQPVLHVLLPSS